MVDTAKKTKPVSGRKVTSLLCALLAAVLCGVGLWYVGTNDPTTGSSIFPPCLFHSLTGLWCTGCGVTRALHFILNGQFYQGFRMNPLAVVSLPFLIWAVILVFYRMYRHRPMPKIPTWAPWAIAAVIVLYTVARNLPWQPFSWLAPTLLPWVRQ